MIVQIPDDDPEEHFSNLNHIVEGAIILNFDQSISNGTDHKNSLNENALEPRIPYIFTNVKIIKHEFLINENVERFRNNWTFP